MRTRRCHCLPSVLLLLLAAVLMAADAVRAQPDSPPVPAPDEAAPEAALQARFEPILARIDRLRLEGGRYHPELSEALLSLGLIYRHAGEREQAARAFAEAAIILRANHGLHDLGQMGYFDLLAEEFTALARVEDLVAVHRQMYWLHQNAWGELDPRLLPVIERIVRGQIGLGSELGPAMVVGGSALIDRLMGDWLAIMESAFGREDPRWIESNYARARVYYDLARSASSGVTDRSNVRRCCGRSRRAATFETSGTRSRHSLENSAENSLEFAIQRAERSGRAALQTVVDAFSAGWERNPDTFAEPLATALIHLGDWSVLFGAPGSRQHYRKAYELLGSMPDGRLRPGEIFESSPMLPVAVTFSRDAMQPAAGEFDAAQRSIEVAFEVTASGRAADFEVIRSASGLEESADLLVELLSGLRFRPALVDGRLVAQRVTRRFALAGAQGFVELGRRPEYVDSAALAAPGQSVRLAAEAPL